MQISVETTQGLERRLTIKVPAESVESEVKNRLQRLAKTQRINGFRPGKVPVNVIKKRFGQAVRQEVAGEVMQNHFYQAVIQEKLNPAGMPTFDLVQDKSGEDLEFAASFEVYPEITLQGLDELEISKDVVDISDEDMQEMMHTLQKQHAGWKTVEQEAGENDKLTIDFEGKVDGEVFEGGTAEDFSLELGKGSMIPGFEEPLLGARAGEEKIVDVTFPEEYHAEKLKGKDAQFKINIKKVEALDLPEIDAEFAKMFGVEDGDIDGLKEEVRKNMQRELDHTLKSQLKEQVITALLDKNQIDLPKALIEQEINALREQSKQRFAEQTGGKLDNLPDLPDNLFEDNARRRVSIGLLLGEVIKVNDIKVDQDKVEAMIETNASAYEDPQEVIDYYHSNEQLMQQMQSVAMEEQAIEALIASAKVNEVSKSFSEVMNKQG
jgi:trigger factor